MKPVLLRWLACTGLFLAPIGVARAYPPQAQVATAEQAADGTATSAALAPSPGSGAGAASVSGQPSVPGAIALAEISTRAEETAEHLRAIVSRLESSANLEEGEAAVADLGKRLQTDADDTNAVLQLEPQLSILSDLVHGWREARQHISALSAKATAHTSDCSAALDEIQKLAELWTRTGEAARAQGAPAELIGRVDATLGDLKRTHERILALRDRLLAVQAESTRQLGVCDELLARLEQSRHEEAEELGLRTGEPVWRARPEAYGRDALFRPILIESRNELTVTAAFLRRHSSFLPLQLVLFAFLAVLMRRVRSRAKHWKDCGPEIHQHLTVLELPYSVALILTGLCAYAFQPDAPRLLFDVVGTLLAVPILRILQRVVHPILMRPIWGLVALRVVDRLQDYIAGSRLLEQVLLCLIAGGGLVFTLWSVSPRQTRGIALTQREASWFAGVTWAGRCLAITFGIAFVAGTFGYINLARFLSSTVLVTVNAALGFFVAARVLVGLWDLSLAVRPLAALRMVEGHRPLIARWSATLIFLIAVAGWLFTIRSNLERLGLRTDTLRRIAAISVSFGSVTVSLGDLFFFGITLWGSVLLSRFIRFVLDEELFPRFRLAPGLSYALSNLIHYSILMMGLLLALATLGFDASRLTVMVGALGVGIGFGLQSIVNNFVSGLILLLERPIKTGDTVQVGQMTGEVKRIGVRSSTVRTAEGAEVIVPNSTLISDTVTNWTLSDRSRRFELQVGVAYGTKPARILTMLTEVAKQHPDVLAHPEPNAIFLGFGESSLDFVLRAWVGDGSRLAAVKSAVAVALSEAFDAAGIQIPFPQRDLHIVEAAKR